MARQTHLCNQIINEGKWPIYVFERWCYRGTLHILWTEHQPMRRCLTRTAQQSSSLIDRQLAFHGHLERKASFTFDLMIGCPNGTRPRTIWLKDLSKQAKCANIEYTEDITLPRERIKWRPRCQVHHVEFLESRSSRLCHHHHRVAPLSGASTPSSTLIRT